MALPKLQPQCGARLVLIAALLATIVKGAWALSSQGSSDVFFFFLFGKEYAKTSLVHMYELGPIFNHSPLTAYLMRALYRVANGEYLAFAAALRFLSIFADLAVVGMLVAVKRRTGNPPWWALILFALSPISIMISGFHGNIDPLLVVALTAAALAMASGKPAWAGALLALSANVKAVPVLLAPVFFFYCWKLGRGAVVKFAAAFAIGMLALAAQALVQCPDLYFKNVWGYGSYFGTWGVTYWFHELGGKAYETVFFTDLSPEQMRVAAVLKGTMILAILAFAWRRRAVPGMELLTTLAAAFACLFTLAPGVGPQYLVWCMPFLLWASPRWFAAVTAACVPWMFIFYHASAQWHFPWDLAKPMGPEIKYWGPPMNLAWAGFIALLAVKAKAWWLAKPAVAESATLPDGIPATA